MPSVAEAVSYTHLLVNSSYSATNFLLLVNFIEYLRKTTWEASEEGYWTKLWTCARQNRKCITRMNHYLRHFIDDEDVDWLMAYGKNK